MRTSVADGDAEMVVMLANAKADVDTRGSNVSACIHFLVIVYVFYTQGSIVFPRVADFA